MENINHIFTQSLAQVIIAIVCISTIIIMLLLFHRRSSQLTLEYHVVSQTVEFEVSVSEQARNIFTFLVSETSK